MKRKNTGLVQTNATCNGLGVGDLRDLTRTLKQPGRKIPQHRLHIQETKENASLKLANVVPAILGNSGRAILTALIAGETAPQRLAALAQSNATTERVELVDALRHDVFR